MSSAEAENASRSEIMHIIYDLKLEENREHSTDEDRSLNRSPYVEYIA